MTREEIEKVIKEDINPALEAHGGFIIVQEFNEEKKSLKIQMGGGCQGCAGSISTLKSGVENYLREEFPDIGVIEDVTDHDAGQNPYFEKE
tara:strand:+ start:112 stop:384 length:273 start_codon:yes stop_codon:yes gene_type:complete